MRVLVIEDDMTVLDVLGLSLEQQGIRCHKARSGEEGLNFANTYDYDAIVLDLLLPDMDGYELVGRLRALENTTPILILSGLTESIDKVRGLCVGADDYLTKPFDKQELVARLHAIIRRAKGHAASTIRIGRLSINLESKSATIDDIPLNLTLKEYAILELLAVRRGTTLSKETFLSHLYNGIDEPDLKIIDVFVCKLRKKLAKAADGENYIDTIWGRGYVLREPTPTAVQDASETPKTA